MFSGGSRSAISERRHAQKGREKIDIVIVVDMLLTGFDSKYLNTLYVDKNLKYHSLIRLSAHQPHPQRRPSLWANHRFSGQQKEVDIAIARFSELVLHNRERFGLSTKPGGNRKNSKGESELDEFMKSQV